MFAILDVVCPMHVVLDGDCRIVHAGPTLCKLRPAVAGLDTRFYEHFDLLRPKALEDGQALLAAPPQKLHLRFREPPQTALKGLLAPLPETGGAVINLSFGISIVDSVRDYALTSADFAATDLTVEMLYLIEAKSTAMEASRRLNQRLQGAMIAAEEQAFTDTLTGLKNRRAVDHILPRLAESGRPFAVMQIDLDFFKAVNDTLGHAAGDHVLQQVARVLVEETRKTDTVARVGGDEFVLVFDGLQNRDTLARIATRIIEKLTRPIPFEGDECRISASIGIAVFGRDGANASPKELLADADFALYSSKHKGRGCYHFYDPEMRNGGDS